MSHPKQHHYLPKNALLKFFESSEKEGFLWMYERTKEPIFVHKNNIAKEKHLYSFTNKDGSYNTDIETALAEMESVVSLILEKMNNITKEMTITTQEKSELSYFIAMQVIRTPGFRVLLKKQAAEMAKLQMQMLASNKEVFAHSLKKMQEENPNTPEVSVEEMQKFVFDESRYTIEMGNENYFLKQAIELGDHIYPAIMMKDIFILKSDSIEFITSDYPVNLISDQETPNFYSGGFLMSDVLIPIGISTALLFKNPTKPPQEPPRPDEDISVGCLDIPLANAEWVNNVTIGRAERFLFSTTKSPEVKEGFDSTSTPKRFHMSSPFSNKKEDNGS